jgi:diaminopimelate decarboxylase
MSAGAYGMTMSSNYNARRRPPEILVDGERFYVTRSRETFEQMLWDEKIL